MGDIAIRVENLSKQYHIGGRQERYRTMRDALVDAIGAPFRRLSSVVRGGSSTIADEVIWALKDISFEVKRGEAVGVIGRNGAGKTTLLKILSRITEPTEGYAEIHGRVGSLLEVGTGFHPELTGRENIYLNGAILGMKRTEIDHKFDEIVDFSGVEKFIDTPVKHYSSGMYVRLAFAVAAHLEPEILLVDEVLAVGDAKFQKKCLGKMESVAGEGRTVLFVSHDMGAVRSLCQDAIWLHNGHFMRRASAGEVIGDYLSQDASAEGEVIWEEGYANPGVNDFELLKVCIKNESGRITSTLGFLEPSSVQIGFRIHSELPYCRVGFSVQTTDGIRIFEVYDSDNEDLQGNRFPGEYSISCRIPGEFLAPGQYTLSVNAGIPGVRNLALVENALNIQIDNTEIASSHMLGGRRGMIRPRFPWHIDKVSNGH